MSLWQCPRHGLVGPEACCPESASRVTSIELPATPASAPVVVPPKENQGAASAGTSPATPTLRLSRAAFHNCVMCWVFYGSYEACRGHDEADTLRVLSLDRLALHNASVAALLAELQLLRSEATPKEVAVGSSGVGTTLEPSDAAIRTAKEMLANYGTPTATQIVRRILIAAYKADARRAASPSDADTERRNGGCPECGRAAAEFHRARCSRRTHDQEVDVPRAGEAVVAFWDSLDAVTESDERPTESFKVEMDRRIDALRIALECRTRSGIVHREEGTRLGGSNG